ncbi:MAG: DUF4160 domain-containing protein [Sphingobacteriales bacterium]|nr:DUF4160 domain-containing protein [Sphingobacteriales bacterium]
MPQISRFFGIIICMYFDNHYPPHFHAIYNEYEAEISITSLAIIKGNLPARVLGLVIEWATNNKDELLLNWHRIENNIPPEKIKPLE